MTRAIRGRATVVVLALAATAAAMFYALAGPTPPASGAGDAAVAQAQELTAAPDVDRKSTVGYAADGAARAAAARAVEHVPLPEGGNVNGIQWEAAGGVFSAAEVETVVEANAFCQWLRAYRDGRDVSTALRVLEAVPDWPAMRDQPDGFNAGVVAEVGKGSGPRLDAALRDCDVSHQQEVAYAAKLGLVPSG